MLVDPEIGLIDRIYEAAFVPEFWPDVLDDLAMVSGAAGGCISVVDGDRPLGARQSECIREIGEQTTASPDAGTVQRFGYACANHQPGFLVSSSFFPKEMQDDDPLVRTKLEQGFREEAISLVPMPGGEIAMFSIDRRIGNGLFQVEEIERLNRVHPHLARAGLMAARLRLEQAQNTAFAFQALGLPAAVLSSAGRVRASNELFDAMAAMLVPTAFGGIAVVDPAANGLFWQAVEAAAANIQPVVRSIPVKAKGSNPPLVIHVLPLRRSAHDIFSGADILVAVTAVSASNLVPSSSVLTGLFDLAPSEARLAIALTQGHSLKAFAVEAGITFGTARKYLDRIYLKTGTHSQGQLVALLKGA